MPEWLIERGIGETRAALVEDSEIIEARVMLEGTVAAGSVIRAWVTEVPDFSTRLAPSWLPVARVSSCRPWALLPLCPPRKKRLGVSTFFNSRSSRGFAPKLAVNPCE